MCNEKKVKIGIDTFGADNGCDIFVEAAKLAIATNDNIELYLYGDHFLLNNLVKKYSVSNDNIFIVDAKEEIKVDEHPVMALRTKKNSSLYRAGEDLLNGKIDALISAGSTGAILALAQL